MLGSVLEAWWVSNKEPEAPEEAPLSLDYVHGPKHPPSPDYVLGPKLPPLPVYVPYVPECKYLEYLVPSDVEAPIEDQPQLDDASPTALSSGYVVDSYLEEDPKKDHVDYPADRGDGDYESSDDENDDDADDADDDEDENASKDDGKEEDDELLATTDSSDVPVVDLVPSARDTEAFETDEATLEADLRRHRVREMCYGITDTWDSIVEAMQEIASTTLKGANQRVIELSTTVRQDTDEFYMRFEDAQDDRSFLRARVNTLFRDRPYHRHTTMLLDREAMYAHGAWAGFEDRSVAIEAYVRTLEGHVTTLMAQTSSVTTRVSDPRLS
uniref:Reverse transcriptase domain-containing protein n=1 Tax=Tanacetum cinerariifolium TaxID=118510 RepID=A0A6L2KAI3_TANCI|nr:hypothetical protein [Tanacetum cinerariifolium]